MTNAQSVCACVCVCVCLQAGRSRTTDRSVVDSVTSRGILTTGAQASGGRAACLSELGRLGHKPVAKLAKARGHENYSNKSLRCLLVDVRGDDRASGHIQALSARFADCCFGLGVWRESVCPISRRLQGAVQEPTSFQAPLLNRAGPPREGVGALETWDVAVVT